MFKTDDLLCVEDAVYAKASALIKKGDRMLSAYDMDAIRSVLSDLAFSCLRDRDIWCINPIVTITAPELTRMLVDVSWEITHV